jgi:hypothetical protein
LKKLVIKDAPLLSTKYKIPQLIKMYKAASALKKFDTRAKICPTCGFPPRQQQNSSAKVNNNAGDYITIYKNFIYSDFIIYFWWCKYNPGKLAVKFFYPGSENVKLEIFGCC